MKNTAVSPSVQNRDVVIIKEYNVARNLWKLGRVEELIMSEDSHVRGAVVRVARAGKPVLLRRPVQCLYPLEVPHIKNSLPMNDIKIDGDNDTKELVADPVQNVLPVEKPRVRCTAAIEGDLRRRHTVTMKMNRLVLTSPLVNWGDCWKIRALLQPDPQTLFCFTS